MNTVIYKISPEFRTYKLPKIIHITDFYQLEFYHMIYNCIQIIKSIEKNIFKSNTIMKTKRIYISALFICLLLSAVYGQKSAMTSGSIDFLKQEKIFKVEFSYEDMAVGNFKTEAEYIEYKKGKKGEGFAEKWANKKKTLWEPYFTKGLNKKLGKLGYQVSLESNSKYKFLVKPFFVEEGEEFMGEGVAAIVRLQIFVIETETNKQVAEFRIVGNAEGDQIGGGADAFKDAGIVLGKLILDILN